MKKYKVSWWTKEGDYFSSQPFMAESKVHAVAKVEKSIEARTLSTYVVMLKDGFITEFEVEEIGS